MTKADLIAAVAARNPSLKRTEVATLVESVFEQLKAALEAGEDVKVSGFGKWSTRDKAARPGRNPQTGERITISARRVVSFKVSEVLKRELNEGEE